MNNKGIAFVGKYFTKRATTAFWIVLLIIQAVFINHSMPILWLLIASGTVVAFFYYLHNISKSWSKLNDVAFRKKLFKYALIIRIIFVISLYYFFLIIYETPFEAGAADARFYDGAADDVSYYILSGNFNLFNSLFYLDLSDQGYPIFLGLVYVVVFKSLLLGRIVNAFLGAKSCLIVYDFTKRNFNEQTAKLAGIMMMLLPNLIYYCGLTLKESVLIFLVISFVNRADILLREKKIKIMDIILLTLLGFSLFMFRTVLAVSMILSLFSSILIMNKRVSVSGRRVFLGVWIIIASILIFNTSLGDTISNLISTRDDNQESQLQNFSSRQEGNAFAKYGSKSLFIPMILIAPFPTFVDTRQDNEMMLSGAMFTHNVYAFFVIIGLITMYRKKLLRKYSLIIISFSSYLLVIASSGFALSERFHLPAVPFLLILAAYGITEMNSKNIKYFGTYLVFISLVIIGWNWFKLAGRGLY